ncbi:flagellar hook-length control protein FliK [Undibacterium sp.]|uniref:flagellar hook-length control protein FliK n=1 Tax=Undibacterium sp. TaxID=1914977 RepID=UPI00374DC7B5
MRANPLLPQADLLPAAATSKSSSSDVTGPSFNQFLSNEVSSPKNNPAPAPSQNNVNNNNNANNNGNNNNNNVNNNNNDNSANNQVDSKAPDKPAQADAGSKTDKPKDAKDKDDDADSTQAAGAADQTPAGQIIALVQNLGKLTAGNDAGKTDDKKVDVSAVAGAINSAMLDKSKQLDAKIGPEVAADAAKTTDAKAVKASTPDFKTDVDAASKKLADAVPADKSDVKDKADTTKPVDVAAAKDASAAKDTPLKAPVEAVAGADQKLQAAQDLAASKALMQDGAAAVAPVQQNFAQQLAATATQANSAADAEHLSPRVGSPGWDQAVGQKVVWMVAGGKQTAELTLNPPDLGPMQVVLSVNNDKATATFVTAQPEVRDALESAMPKLRQMMSDAGVQLSGFSVSTQSSNQGGQYSGNTPSNSRRSSHGVAGPDTGPISSISGATATSSVRTGKLGMVDTFA